MSHNGGKWLVESEKQNIKTNKKNKQQSSTTFKIKSKVAVSWMHKHTHTGEAANLLWSLLQVFKEAPPLIASRPLVAALDAAPIRLQGWDHMGGAGGRQVAPIRGDRCAGRNQGTAEPPIMGQESCRTRLQGGERSMTDDLIDGQWKQIYFLIPLPPSLIKSPWIYSFFSLSLLCVTHSLSALFLLDTLKFIQTCLFSSCLPSLPPPPWLVYPRMLIADPAALSICCRGMLTSSA